MRPDASCAIAARQPSSETTALGQGRCAPTAAPEARRSKSGPCFAMTSTEPQGDVLEPRHQGCRQVDARQQDKPEMGEHRQV